MDDAEFYQFLDDWMAKRPDLLERLSRKSGFISPEVFKTESERRKADAEVEAELRRQVEAELRQLVEGETMRWTMIQGLHKNRLTDMEIAEIMNMDLKAIQIYIAVGEDA